MRNINISGLLSAKVKLVKSVLVFNMLHLLLLFLLMLYINVTRASMELETKFSGTLVRGGCSVTIPPVVDMGEFEVNKNDSSTPFDIKIDCGNITLNTALWAEVIKGQAVEQGSTIEMIANGNPSKPFKMELRHRELNMVKRIDVRGLGETSDAWLFCQGVSTRDCTVTPYFYGNDAAGMSASASVRFNLRYR
ncbi:hypothetical protein K9D52_004707 [Salmonella enterica]|nr:hypothetical protein [Salmonella enterica]HBD3707515.1 hypothetical protein [Escherichia coli]